MEEMHVEARGKENMYSLTETLWIVVSAEDRKMNRKRSDVYWMSTGFKFSKCSSMSLHGLEVVNV